MTLDMLSNISRFIITIFVTVCTISAGLIALWRYVHDAMKVAIEPPAAVSIKKALMWAGIAAASRLLLYGLSLFMANANDIPPIFSEIWVRWDAKNYLSIAQEGYQATGDKALFLVFFPLYPLLVRIFMFITRDDAFWAAIILSNLCYAAAAGMLYAFVAGRYGNKSGGYAVLWLIVWPVSFFNAAPMSEALFLMLCAACMLLVDRDKLLLAGLIGMLCAFTRSLGIIIALPIFLRGLRMHPNGKMRVWRGILGALTVSLGLLSYLAVNYYVSGNPLQFLIYQRENWHQQAGFFWDTVGYTVTYLFYYDDNFFYVWLPQILSIILCSLILHMSLRRIDSEYVLYFIAMFVVSISPTWLLSGARYIMGIFPLYVTLGIASEKSPKVWIPLLSVSVCLLIVNLTSYIWYNTIM